MTWGNHKSIVALVEKLADREGFGDMLADVLRRLLKESAKALDNMLCMSQVRKSSP